MFVTPKFPGRRFESKEELDEFMLKQKQERSRLIILKAILAKIKWKICNLVKVSDE